MSIVLVVFFYLPYCISLFIVHHHLQSHKRHHHPSCSPRHHHSFIITETPRHAATIITQPYQHRHHPHTHLTTNISPPLPLLLLLPLCIPSLPFYFVLSSNVPSSTLPCHLRSVCLLHVYTFNILGLSHLEG